MKNEVDDAVQYVMAHKLSVCTAESCTAGLIVSFLAEIEGCSEWLEGGFVTHSPMAKMKTLHVSKRAINTYGLTSETVAREMAMGALKYGTALIAVPNTGLAGPPPGAIRRQQERNALLGHLRPVAVWKRFRRPACFPASAIRYERKLRRTLSRGFHIFIVS